MRLDKWLWAARFFKTRSLCKSAIENGKIRVNNDRPKTSRKINIGDFISIKKSQIVTDIEVLGLSEQRSSAPIAQTLYQETQESIKNKEEQAKIHKGAPKIQSIKPTKKTDRRALLKQKRNE